MSIYFGFDQIQSKTLQALGFDSAAITDLEDAIVDLVAQDVILADDIADLVTDLAAAVAVNGTQATSITNLNAWATALATKLNADFTQNNAAIAGAVFDVNYDTDPQA